MFKLNTINEIPYFTYMFDSSNLWLGRLGHINYKNIKRMIELKLINNLGDLSNDKCITYSKYKIACSSFKSVERALNILDMIYNDIDLSLSYFLS